MRVLEFSRSRIDLKKIPQKGLLMHEIATDEELEALVV